MSGTEMRRTAWIVAGMNLVLLVLLTLALREVRAARAELEYRTARWAECETELESYRE